MCVCVCEYAHVYAFVRIPYSFAFVLVVSFGSNNPLLPRACFMYNHLKLKNLSSCPHSAFMCFMLKGKGKVIPLQARCGPESG